ncbi:glycosyl transferase [Rhizobium sp. R72]|uniref:lytic transglycosylase domain-containing protein n=1 Tax=unclassified Rhizobium TaxID=2613769 RepID=UPI000B530906|nr:MULTISPECIES: lytic transglycosylase domain-containing protein [unclassified Rhizobium]OWV86928.1 glycosyl transferase [Rhizobium sp. R693]OWV95634.1 glycosyl transferase [Rhizobium sp. R72]OWV95934.1 glycosyl transferase [Rhizobium sp. R711]
MAAVGVSFGKGLMILIAGFLLALPEIAFSQPPAATSHRVCIYSLAIPQSGERLCITRETYGRDLCVAIDHFARENHLPPEYFARLIWRESSFRAGAVSPKGAQGIAQFMPGTARLRGLRDSFDVLESLKESARYLDELRTRFGNLGLAAAAYNAGERGLADYLDTGLLPFETRSYVLAITANTIEQWKSDPPVDAAQFLSPDKPFIDGCIELASNRRLTESASVQQGPWAPWGAQLAANSSDAAALRLFTAVARQLPSPLAGEEPVIVRMRDHSFGFRPRYAARIGRQTRAEADKVCVTVRAAGAACTVFRN